VSQSVGRWGVAENQPQVLPHLERARETVGARPENRNGNEETESLLQPVRTHGEKTVGVTQCW